MSYITWIPGTRLGWWCRDESVFDMLAAVLESLKLPFAAVATEAKEKK